MTLFKNSVVFCFSLFIGIGILTFMSFNWNKLPHMSFISEDFPQLQVNTFLKEIPKRFDCRASSDDDQCKLLNLTKTSGHLRLPVEESLFKSNTVQLGITDQWQSRLRLLQQGCRDRKELQEKQTIRRYMFSKKYNFGFCKAPKTGCTFITNLYQVLQVGKSIQEVFQRKRDAVHVQTMKYLTTMPDDNHDFIKILVSRDPYSRLFSGYIDKVFLFGFKWAHNKVAKHAGNKPYKFKGEQCGFVTPFQDFIELFIGNAVRTGSCNPHWRSVVDMCNACAIDFQLVLRTETLTDDTKFLLDQLKLEDDMKNSIMAALRHNNNSNDVIRGLVQDYVKYVKHMKDVCPKMITSMHRLWEGFKILGYINKSVEFPESRFKALSNITSSTAADIIIDTLEKHPLSKSEKSQQRRNAMIEAYRQVNAERIGKIKEYFKYDFILFGYDEEPPHE